MDLRRSTVAWHGRGDYVFPNVIMASGDMVAIDTEAVKILKAFLEDNRITLPVEELGQFVAAKQMGLGSMEYKLRVAEAHTGTEEKGVTDPAAIQIMMDRSRERKPIET
jgi:uncharacterized protein (DUF362 family)